ncbi:hypothetical protein DFH06DRAFT_1432593 [Mycena polygramma]|nr:hypothetical protein DFH06DRAFT_1432593 [Mycena polygramma]
MSVFRFGEEFGCHCSSLKSKIEVKERSSVHVLQLPSGGRIRRPQYPDHSRRWSAGGGRLVCAYHRKQCWTAYASCMFKFNSIKFGNLIDPHSKKHKDAVQQGVAGAAGVAADATVPSARVAHASAVSGGVECDINHGMSVLRVLRHGRREISGYGGPKSQSTGVGIGTVAVNTAYGTVYTASHTRTVWTGMACCTATAVDRQSSPYGRKHTAAYGECTAVNPGNNQPLPINIDSVQISPQGIFGGIRFVHRCKWTSSALDGPASEFLESASSRCSGTERAWLCASPVVKRRWCTAVKTVKDRTIWTPVPKSTRLAAPSRSSQQDVDVNLDLCNKLAASAASRTPHCRSLHKLDSAYSLGNGLARQLHMTTHSQLAVTMTPMPCPPTGMPIWGRKRTATAAPSRRLQTNRARHRPSSPHFQCDVCYFYVPSFNFDPRENDLTAFAKAVVGTGRRVHNRAIAQLHYSGPSRRLGWTSLDLVSHCRHAIVFAVRGGRSGFAASREPPVEICENVERSRHRAGTTDSDSASWTIVEREERGVWVEGKRCAETLRLGAARDDEEEMLSVENVVTRRRQACGGCERGEQATERVKCDPLTGLVLGVLHLTTALPTGADEADVQGEHSVGWARAATESGRGKIGELGGSTSFAPTPGSPQRWGIHRRYVDSSANSLESGRTRAGSYLVESRRWEGRTGSWRARASKLHCQGSNKGIPSGGMHFGGGGVTFRSHTPGSRTNSPLIWSWRLRAVDEEGEERVVGAGSSSVRKGREMARVGLTMGLVTTVYARAALAGTLQMSSARGRAGRLRPCALPGCASRGLSMTRASIGRHAISRRHRLQNETPDHISSVQYPRLGRTDSARALCAVDEEWSGMPCGRENEGEGHTIAELEAQAGLKDWRQSDGSGKKRAGVGYATLLRCPELDTRVERRRRCARVVLQRLLAAAEFLREISRELEGGGDGIGVSVLRLNPGTGTVIRGSVVSYFEGFIDEVCSSSQELSPELFREGCFGP